MLKEITIEDAIKLVAVKYIDVRSPAEYQEATIPGAINVPLLSDEERVTVGTIYKRQSPAEAKRVGMELIAPKLPQISKELTELANKHQLVILCWRGGMRSLTVSLVLQLMGLPVFRLIGGYKAYRQYVNKFFEQANLPQRAIVLQGLTGVGKTEILLRLEEEGLPAINLEAMACNRGSVFGWVGQREAPSQKMFESVLLDKLISYSDKRQFFVECESRKVGKIFLPPVLLKAMETGKHILLYDTMENRVKRLVKDYTQDLDPEELFPSINLLTERLGKSKVQAIRDLLLAKRFEEVAEILLVDYYDPLYKYPSKASVEYDLCVSTADMDQAIKELKKYYSITSES